MTRDDYTAMMDGRLLYYAYGFLRYKDIFGAEDRFTYFGYRFYTGKGSEGWSLAEDTMLNHYT